MKKWPDQIKKWFVAVSDIPEDILLDLPRITMIGQSHLTIENHKGVLAFSGNELRLSVDGGVVGITGEGFILEHIRDKEIFLKGRIQSVQFIED